MPEPEPETETEEKGPAHREGGESDGLRSAQYREEWEARRGDQLVDSVQVALATTKGDDLEADQALFADPIGVGDSIEFDGSSLSMKF